MSTVKLSGKNKIIGLRSWTESEEGSLVDKMLTHQNGEKGNPTAGGTVITDPKLLMISRINELESALQVAREEAFQAGFEEGKEAALMETKRQLEDLSEEFSAMVQSLKDQYDLSLENMNKPLLKLAMKIAEKIIGRELKHEYEHNEILLNQIEQLLNEVTDQNHVTIYINPNQIDWVSGKDMNAELNIPSIPDITFVRDKRLKPGECLLETDNYIIEGVLSTKLNNLANKILEEDAFWTD